MFSSKEIYFVTVRCIQGRLLLRPSKQTNEVLAGILARGSRLFSVELFAFVFASNHFHLVVRAPEGKLPRFMQFVLTNTSKKVGWLSDWRGSFWERRYSAEPVLDDEALLGRVRYVLAHGVKERLVRRCAEWPGLSSLEMMLGSSSRAAKWFNWTRRWRNRSQLGHDRYAEAWVENEQLTLSVLPTLAERSAASRRRLCLQSVEAIEKAAALDPSPVFGAGAVLTQSPHFRPARPARRPRPICHASTQDGREGFKHRYRSWVARFREASEAWRRGVKEALFPEGAFRPFVSPASILAAA